MRRLWGSSLIAIVLLAAIGTGVVWRLNLRDEAPITGDGDGAAGTSPELIAQGAYLARAGNCAGCHTERGGTPYAGGRGVATPFGIVYAPNLTPDAATGLGHWTRATFWRAMHHGRSRDGRLLYPVFPYPNYTQVTRADSDALFAYLRSLPATARANRPHALRFPFDQQASLAIWRALYFTPGSTAGSRAAEAGRSAAWQRGAYLVEGLGHCNACHSSRNALGASVGPLDLGGGLIPVQNWYAPSLISAAEAGVADWAPAEIVALLKTGVSAHATVLGPMAEVVVNSTQYLGEADLGAMAIYLKALPQQPAAATAARAAVATGEAMARGAKLYEAHCAACHGDRGEGVPAVYPALAGNRAVTLDPPANLVHVVLEGGFAPATAGHPRPYGMPPFGPVLGNDELADLLSFIRGTWGNHAAAVSNLDVNRYREGR